jgi:beta-mannosidase
VTVLARAFSLDTLVLADVVAPGARSDDGLVTLFPGERHTFRVTGVGPDAADRLAGVVRCANEVIRPHA